MTAAPLAPRVPSSQASYPPQRATPQPAATTRPVQKSPSTIAARLTSKDDGHPPRIISYLVNTASASISDLRLQVTEDPQSSLTSQAGPSSSSIANGHTGDDTRPPKPIWRKERELTEDDEILDTIVDATTGKASWTIHRPTRGWYLHIRSPLLPPGFTIPLRPARPDYVASTTGVRDPASTPLTFTVGTRINEAALKRCRCCIQDVVEEMRAGSQSRGEGSRDGSSDAQDFIAVELGSAALPSSSNSAARDGFHAGHTARVSSISASLNPNGVHSRKRSIAGPVPGTSDALPVPPQTSESKTDSQPTCHKVDEQDESDTDAKTIGHSAEARLNPNRQAGDPLTLATLQSTSPSLPAPHTPPKPTKCYFLLVDGAAASGTSHLPAEGGVRLAPGRVAEGSHRLGWARWVWSLVPEPIRPPLAFDTAKSFSVRWIDVPSPTTTSTSTSQSDDRSVEVMRYEDQDGWSLWNSKTHGRFVFQAEAVKALGIDISFWVAVGLAYLEFLEERDGYNAASEG